MVSPILSIQKLSKKFGAVIANEDVSIDLYQGEIHGLIGPNGAGKSTLIKQISGEINQDSGKIILEENEISNHPVFERAKMGLARSFQVSSVIPNFTVLENVILAIQGNLGQTFKFWKPVSKNQELINTAHIYLEQVDMKMRMSVLASELSHGERRKLEISMALALEPKVFLLDEPMAGLGAAGSKVMTKQLAKLKSRAPILLIEHDMDAIFALADRISVLVYGRIIASGTVDEIRSNADVREAYLGSEDQ
ncbi:MAG: ABC transporter ATP-binding protein [Amylibacter sp.]|nr:ABC transporter ATP-binding protein [Amylibacter sp.]